MANGEREALWAGRVAQWRDSGLSQRAFGVQQGYPQRQLSATSAPNMPAALANA
jgi:hypothetical protein